MTLRIKYGDSGSLILATTDSSYEADILTYTPTINTTADSSFNANMSTTNMYFWYDSDNFRTRKTFQDSATQYQSYIPVINSTNKFHEALTEDSASGGTGQVQIWIG